ncbi:MFS transporter [Amycolatopsis sp. WAC 01416]|uniref:MFS transporter n=1 Tax=Amycolatopsis sp. WAC 01416 TaxID=2203196 RepID=UPI000F7B40C3|nr:MFS transporter [Amycolatopsis sp. WAC 01416]RSN30615.1 MFS transporter [Amycolatopsis sp. WAC 01416]
MSKTSLSVEPAGPSRQRAPRGYARGLFAVNFGVFLAATTPMAVTLAFKIEHISASPGEATANLAVILAVGALFGLVANPVAGRLSDRTTSKWGMRRPWILGGMLVGLAGLFIVGIATSFWVVLAAWCAVQAGTNATVAAASATIPDQVPPSRFGSVSGLVGVATPLGVLAGFTIVNFLADDVPRFVVPALIATALTVWFVVGLEDRVLTEKPARRFTVGQFFGSFVFNPAKHPDFGWTWLAQFLIMFGYGGIASYLPYYLTEKFGFEEQDAIAKVLTVNAVSTATMMISSLAGGFLSDKLGKRRPFVAAAGGFIVVGLVSLAFAPDFATVLLAQAIIGIGAGLFFSVSLALATEVLPDTGESAKDLGVLNTAASLPQSVAPAIAPAIIALGASTPLGGFTVYYLFGAILALTAAVIIYRVKGAK